MPTYDLFAAIWKVKFADSANLSLIEKGVKLTEAAESAYTFMKGTAVRLKMVNPVYVFVAPEYYWIKDANYSLYSAQEKATIYSALKDTSAVKKNLLMFPGTVNWQVPKANHVGTVPTALKDKTFVGYNACPVYLGGELLLDYYKKYNDGELDKRPAAAFAAGPTGGAQDFVAKQLRFGLDICGDLNAGQLSLTLGGQMVDVMILTAGTMAHMFNQELLEKIPVKDGGAFVHCDNSGKAERNGLWALNRGKGWHGTHREESKLTFDDLDNVKRTVGFPVKEELVHGMTMKVSALAGFGALRELDATINDKSRGYVRKFTLTIPGGRAQTAVFEKDGMTDYKVTMTRSMSSSKVRRGTLVSPDFFGMKVSGTGNVDKIGKLHGGPGGDDLDCYSVPIEK